MTTRTTLDTTRIAPKALERLSRLHTDNVAEVESAIGKHDVVVVGMAQNPHCKRARGYLEQAGVPFTYLEYGSYFGGWRQRLAIKQWSGWPTFPQVFVRGTLIGGADDTKAALDDGSLRARLSSPS